MYSLGIWFTHLCIKAYKIGEISIIIFVYRMCRSSQMYHQLFTDNASDENSLMRKYFTPIWDQHRKCEFFNLNGSRSWNKNNILKSALINILQSFETVTGVQVKSFAIHIYLVVEKMNPRNSSSNHICISNLFAEFKNMQLE